MILTFKKEVQRTEIFVELSSNPTFYGAAHRHILSYFGALHLK